MDMFRVLRPNAGRFKSSSASDVVVCDFSLSDEFVIFGSASSFDLVFFDVNFLKNDILYNDCLEAVHSSETPHAAFMHPQNFF